MNCLMNDNQINSGSYAVIYYLEHNTKIFIPRFGAQYFESGYYAYSGSAKRNLISRVKRHIRKEKKLRWHVDYFSVHKLVTPTNVFLFAGRSECEINQFLKTCGGSVIIENFGASDCRNKCISHFLYFKEIPKLGKLIDFGGIDGKLFILQNTQQRDKSRIHI